jgi:hypothetical protein
VRRPLLAAVAVASLAAPGSALADTLVSGYGGPGAGDQTVLGSTLLPESKGGGSGGSGASGPDGLRASTTQPTATAKVTAPALTQTPRTTTAPSASRHATTTAPSRPQGSATTKTPAGRTAAPAVQLKPAGAGALPLGAGEVLLLVAGLGALVALTLTMRRLAVGPTQRPAS